MAVAFAAFANLFISSGMWLCSYRKWFVVTFAVNDSDLPGREFDWGLPPDKEKMEQSLREKNWMRIVYNTFGKNYVNLKFILSFLVPSVAFNALIVLQGGSLGLLARDFLYLFTKIPIKIIFERICFRGKDFHVANLE